MIKQSAMIMLLSAVFILILNHFSKYILSEYNNSWLFINKNTAKILTFYAVSLLAADTLNAWIFQRLRFWLTNRGFWIRSMVSTTISRVIYSAVTVTLLVNKIHLQSSMS